MQAQIRTSYLVQAVLHTVDVVHVDTSTLFQAMF